jgi:hypothetical protein
VGVKTRDGPETTTAQLALKVEVEVEVVQEDQVEVVPICCRCSKVVNYINVFPYAELYFLPR